MAVSSSCPFCRPEELQTRTVEATAGARVILSNPRLMPGHLLVMPTRHVEAPWGLERDEWSTISVFIQIYQRRLSDVFGGGCDLWQRYRPMVPQGDLKVNHIHYHLLPVTDDSFARNIFGRDHFHPLDTAEAEAMKRRLASRIT